MPRENKTPSWHHVGSVAAVILVVAALYLGKAFFVPFALAVLLGFLLAPVVHGLERLHVARIPAVVVTLVLSSAVIAGMAWVVYEQVDQLADRLPSYRENVRRKISAIRTPGPLRKIQERLADLMPGSEEPSSGEAPSEPAGGQRRQLESDRKTADPQAVPVTVIPARPTSLQSAEDTLGALLAPLSTTGVVLVLLLFFLVYQEDLRNRLIRLVSRHELVRTTQAISDVSHRISRYLLMTLIVNVTYGLPIGLGLWLLGVPNALLWGMLATVLRFIPYIGPWIAAVFPIFLSFASSPGWGLTFAVVGLFVVLELISNNLVEPWLYGKRTGLAPVAVVVAAIFWTWLWGTVGLLLAIPITLVLAVVGRYVPQLKFLNIMLRDEPGLRPDERYYQRLVAGDPEEAAAVAEAHARAHGRTQAYDEVIIPALRASRYDALDGRLDADSLTFVRESTRTLVEDFSDRHVGKDAAGEPVPPAEAHANEMDASATQVGDSLQPSPPASALLISAGDETDALTLSMLADALQTDGMRVKVLPGAVLTSEALQAVEDEEPDVVCIGGIPPYVVLRARHLTKRIRAANPSVRVVLGLWGAESSPDFDDRLKAVGVDQVVTSVRAAAKALRALAPLAGAPARRRPPAGVPAPEPAASTRE